MKRNKKKLKKIIANVMLYTICWRNVDKLNDIWIYAKYDLLGGNMSKKKKELGNYNCKDEQIKQVEEQNKKEKALLILAILNWIDVILLIILLIFDNH